MDQPLGSEITQKLPLVCKLHKTLYGLRQAPRAWFVKLHNALVNFSFVSVKSDQSLFVRTPHSITYLLVYADDILITGKDKNTVHSLIQ